MLDNNIAPAGGPTYTVRGPSRTWVIVGVVLGLIVFAGIGSIIYKGAKNSEKTAGHDANSAVISSQSGEINYAPTEEILSDSFGKYELNEEGFRDYSVMLDGESIQMNWYSPARQVEISKKNEMLVAAEPYYEQFLNGDNADDYYSYLIPNTSSTMAFQTVYLYEAGEIAKPDSLAGKKVYYLLTMDFGVFRGQLVIHDEAAKKFVKLAIDGQDLPTKLKVFQMGDDEYAPAFFSGYIIDNVRSVLDLPANLKIGISEKDSTYLYPLGTYSKPYDYIVTDSDGKKYVRQGFPPADNVGGIIDVTKGTNVADELKDVVVAGANGVGDVYYFGMGYAMKRADGSAATLEVMPSFATADPDSRPSENLRLAITWKEGVATATDTFDFLGPFRQSCGVVMHTGQSIVDEEPGFDPKNLQVVGTAKNGDEIYEIKDAKNNAYLSKVAEALQFTSNLSAWGETAVLAEIQEIDVQNNPNYLGEYLGKYHQIFFWKDPIGHYHAFKKHSFQTMAECGKPVIYLYPEKTLTANVQVAPNGGFSKTDPDYGIGGWNVTAEPDGVLTNLANGLNYPYLFWEGKAYSYDAPTKGFVLKRENVDRDMNKILAKYGLNEKESADFMEFWGEKLKVKPYVFVGFLNNKEFDPIAPLTVSPVPQTVIRIFMDYSPLDSDMYVSAPRITTPVRAGFTVVEWGGRLR